jgi:2-methylcitrate dehydratase PrpD
MTLEQARHSVGSARVGERDKPISQYRIARRPIRDRRTMASTEVAFSQPTEQSRQPATVSAQLARFVEQLTLDEVPESVRGVARDHLLDGLGIALASSQMDFAESVHRAAVDFGTADQAHVIGFGTSMPAASAALVNGTLIHGLDFDDTHIEAIYHATAPALAAALAVGEAERRDGSEVLLAYVVGLEVGCRIAAAATGRFHDRGFHPTGIAGTFAAACVAAKLRRQSAAVLTNALGICASQAAGTLEIGKSWLKRLHPGWAAHSGIVASRLAGAGFQGPATVFEGPRGLYASHIDDPRASEGIYLETLGSAWLSADIAIKPYPCCHFNQSFIDAALAVVSEHGGVLHPDEVDRIVCPTSERIMSSVTEPVEKKVAPATIYDAQFSVQYAVAYALTRGRVDLATFYDDPLDSPDVLAMAAKVTCPPDAESDFPRHFPGEVIVYLHGDVVRRNRVRASRGTPDNPLSAAHVTAKFLSNASRVLPVENARALASTVGAIEGVSDIASLMAACVAARR